jgi:hypothetical protein
MLQILENRERKMEKRERNTKYLEVLSIKIGVVLNKIKINQIKMRDLTL